MSNHKPNPDEGEAGVHKPTTAVPPVPVTVMSDETRKQGSVLPLGESLAGFLCSDGVFRVKSGEFRRATVGEWWQDKANGRVYCVNSEYPQDILVEPDLPAPSQTEGGGPDDTKQVSKEQGASPSVTPAVTTDPRIDDRREDENVAARLYEAHMGTRDLIAPPGWDELPQFVRDSWLRQAAEPSMRCTAADARDIATEAHKGQTDRLGNPYIEHVERVAQGFSGGALTVALLHDVIEDSDHTLGSLLDAGVPLDLLPAIDALTRRENETYRSYILRVRDDHIAKLVKRADLRDHLKPDRSGGIGKHQRDKYELALMVLG